MASSVQHYLDEATTPYQTVRLRAAGKGYIVSVIFLLRETQQTSQNNSPMKTPEPSTDPARPRISAVSKSTQPTAPQANSGLLCCLSAKYRNRPWPRPAPGRPRHHNREEPKKPRALTSKSQNHRKTMLNHHTTRKPSHTATTGCVALNMRHM